MVLFVIAALVTTGIILSQMYMPKSENFSTKKDKKHTYHTYTSKHKCIDNDKCGWCMNNGKGKCVKGNIFGQPAYGDSCDHFETKASNEDVVFKAKSYKKFF